MKVKVEDDLCIGCGACASICSEVFDLNDEGISQVVADSISKDQEEDVKEAIESCPTNAIVEE